MSRRRRWTLALPLLAAASCCACVTTSLTRAVVSADDQTHRTASGALAGTRSLPPMGRGYRTHSLLGSALGRQYAHHAVIESVVAAAATLHEAEGGLVDIAEIGHRRGGRFSPHVTHRDGLSVDILTPMRDAESHAPARLGTALWNLYGYCWRIDDRSHRLAGLGWDATSGPRLCPTLAIDSDKEVDFDRLRRLLQELDREARGRGGRLRIVIVDPSFIAPLAGVGVPLTSRAWIAHDDHVHVEFRFPTPAGP